MYYHRLGPTGTTTPYDFAALRDAVDTALATEERVLAVDLDGIGFLDAAIIRELIRALRRLRDRGGNLSVETTRPGVLTSLRVTGLDRVFRIISAA